MKRTRNVDHFGLQSSFFLTFPMMFSVRRFSALQPMTPIWICRACRHQQQQQRQQWHRQLGYLSQGARRNASISPKLLPHGNPASKLKRRRKRVLLFATSGAVILGVSAFNDDARVVFSAIQRTGRVLATLTLCVNE